MNKSIIPFTDCDPLTWNRVEEGCEAARWAFQTFWYLFAVTAKQEFFELAADIARRCPAECRTFAFSVKLLNPLSDHEKYVRLYENPTGINLWFELLDVLPAFGLFEKRIIAQSDAIPHFDPLLFSERRLGEIKTLSKALLASSPWPNATWAKIKMSEGSPTLQVLSEISRELSVTEISSSTNAVQRVVILPNGSIIRSFVDHPGPQTYG